MFEYRLHWLLAGIVCTILAACVLAVGLIVTVAEYTCSEEITEYIGKFDSKEAGVHAALPKMAAELARCPNAKVYRVMWVGPAQGASRHSVLYERRDNRIGYEDDFLSSFSDETYVVDDTAIRAIAEKGGTLEDFAQYDQRGK
jgi:hypothetical protein